MSEAYGYTFGRIMMENLSSFWTRVFQDPDVIQAEVSGTAESLAQSYFNLLELILSKSVHDIPVFHREKWTLLLFNESDRNRNAASLLRYGGGAVYGPQPPTTSTVVDFTYPYGGYFEGATSSFALPEGMVNIESYVMNRIHEPSLVMTAGQDFFVQNGVIFFKANPFENELIPKRDIQDETGEVVDRQIAIWALNSDHDYQFLYENYGSIIGCYFDSSENYKQFLQAVFRLFTVGPRIKFLLSTLNALLGLSVIKEPTETFVRYQVLEDGTQQVVTDKNLYDFKPAVVIRQDLEAGTVLSAFDHLTEAIEIADNVSVPGWWKNYAFLPIPEEIVSWEHFSSIKIFNEFATIPVEWGGTVAIKAIGEMTPERKAFYENFPLIWGGGATWGQGSFSFQPLDLLFQLFWKYNLFLLFIHLDQVPRGKLTSKISDLLQESLPAYVHYVNILEEELDDSYNLETETTDETDFERAHVHTDTYEDFEDGFWGLPRWGMGDVWGDVSYYTTVGFLPGPRFFKVAIPCTE